MRRGETKTPTRRLTFVCAASSMDSLRASGSLVERPSLAGLPGLMTLGLGYVLGRKGW